MNMSYPHRMEMADRIRDRFVAPYMTRHYMRLADAARQSHIKEHGHSTKLIVDDDGNIDLTPCPAQQAAEAATEHLRQPYEKIDGHVMILGGRW